MTSRTTLWSNAFTAAVSAGGVFAVAAGAAQPIGMPPPGPAPAVVWSLDGAAYGIPAYDGDAAYFLSKDRAVVAIDAAAGKLRWRTDTGITNRDHIFGLTTAGNAARVSGHTVVAGDWDVVGFDRATGKRRWVFEAAFGDAPGLYLGDATTDTVFTGSAMARVYAIDTESGRLRWTRAVVEPTGVQTSVYEPILVGDRLAVGYTTHGMPAIGGVVMLDADTGRIRWRTPFPAAKVPLAPSARGGGPVLAGDLLIASSADGVIHALDAETGDLVWLLPPVTGPFPMIAPSNAIDYRALAVSGQTLVAGSSTGIVTAYDLESRQVLWRSNGNYWGSTAFSIAADDRLAYVPYFGGTLIALDMRTGEERWRFGGFGQGFLWAPVPAGDRVFASGSTVGYFALDPKGPAVQP